MKSIQFCPDCYKELAPGHNRCTCGWFSIAESKHDQKPDHFCHHQENGIRCHDFGTVCHSIRGSTWYCRKHASK